MDELLSPAELLKGRYPDERMAGLIAADIHNLSVKAFLSVDPFDTVYEKSQQNLLK
jgi:hypothetical protein